MGKEEVVGIVLAGGESRRFGSPKAFAEKDGIPFYRYSIEAIKDYTDSIVFVTNNTIISRFDVEESDNVHVLTDQEEFTGLGPLAGILTAMNQIDANWYVIVPIDVPFIEKQIFNELLSYRQKTLDAIIPIVNSRMQPLISVFQHSMKEKIKKQLESRELSMKQLFAKSKVRFVEMNKERPFLNINRQEEYTQYVKRLEEC